MPYSNEGKTATLVITQTAGVKTYGPVEIDEFSYPDIPASGGTVTPVLKYHQTWGWNGKTTGGGTITSGASEMYSRGIVTLRNGNVTAASRGISVSDRTSVATIRVIITLNGFSALASRVVYQEANAITSTTYGTPVINFSLPRTSFPNLGTQDIPDQITPSYSAHEPITHTYTSGSSNTVPSTLDGNHVGIESNQDWAHFEEYENPDYFGMQLVVDENTGPQRSAIITVTARGTSHTSTKSITITQSAASIEIRLSVEELTASYVGDSIRISQHEFIINGNTVEPGIPPELSVSGTGFGLHELDGEYWVEVSRNSTNKGRTGIVKLARGQQSKSITITQSSEDISDAQKLCIMVNKQIWYVPRVYTTTSYTRVPLKKNTFTYATGGSVHENDFVINGHDKAGVELVSITGNAQKEQTSLTDFHVSGTGSVVLTFRVTTPSTLVPNGDYMYCITFY